MMPKYRVTAPDGSAFDVSAPDGATESEVMDYAKSQFSKQPPEAKPEKPSFGTMFKREVMGSVPVQSALGALRGAAGIGNTLLPGDRKAGIEGGMAALGADPESMSYGAGKLGAEIAGTAGVGGLLAKPIGAVLGRVAPSVAPMVSNALRTAGMSTGAAPVGMAARTGDLALRAGAGATVGGLSAGLVNPDDAGMGAAIVGAFPMATKAAGAAGSAIGRSFKGSVAPDVGALATRAKELGIDIPVDRLVSSKPLDAVASGLNYLPFSGRAATEAKMNSQLNQALSRTFGQDSSNVTMALRKAGDKLGAEFDNALKNTGVAFDKQLLADVSTVYNKAEAELGSDALKPIASKVNDLIEKGSSGVIDGQAAYNIKRELDRIGRGNTPSAFHALELKGVLMNALNRSLGPDKAAAFAQTRQQYGNMLALEKLARNGVEGELSVARLANMKNINNEPLQELADIAAQFVKPREGQHGAMQRAVVGLTGAAVGGLPGLAAGAGVGRGANMALNSDMLRNAMLGTTKQSATANFLRDEQLRQFLARSAPVIAAQ